MNVNERTTPDSSLLRTFLEIADCGNLTLAASRLNRSQSAISVQLRKLEAELNVSLFERDAKGMALSLNGERLLPVARRVLSELGQVHALFQPALKGKIRVGIPDDFEENVLERTLADFARSNPGVDVVASAGCTVGFPEMVQRGALDIAVYSGPGNIAGQVFLTQKPVWVASETLCLEKSEPVPLAIMDRGCWWQELPTKALEQQGRPYNIAFECSGLTSQKAAIRAGFAIGILYENSVEQGMKVLSLRDGFPPLPLSKRSIILNPDAPRKLTTAMAKALKNASSRGLAKPLAAH